MNLPPAAIARIVQKKRRRDYEEVEEVQATRKAERTSLMVHAMSNHPCILQKKTRSSMMQEKPNVLDWKEEKEEEEDEPEEQDQDEVKEEEEEEAD